MRTELSSDSVLLPSEKEIVSRLVMVHQRYRAVFGAFLQRDGQIYLSIPDSIATESKRIVTSIHAALTANVDNDIRKMIEQAKKGYYRPIIWENQGFPGYDGYAWYRKTFPTPRRYRDHQLYLHLGYIDDVDEVYLNGNLVGYKGDFPPWYDSAFNIFRQYIIPN